MTIEKAQLILVGGRASIPNILTLLHQQPQAVTAICSTESFSDFPRLKNIIEKLLPECHIEAMLPVDAFCPEEIEQRCTEALAKYPAANWIFNITAATTIMSIAAYEIAKKHQHTCWYLNTSQTRVVTLVGDKGDESIFHMEVPQYAAAYNRILEPGELEDNRSYTAQHWLPFAQKLGKNSQQAASLKQVMSKIADRPGKNNPKQYSLKGLPIEVYTVLEEAQQVGLLSHLNRDADSSIRFELSYLQDKFLNGAWLEAYVWDEARNVWDEARKKPLFDDCQWNQKVVDGNSRNELDVALTYKAQLLIAECKTGVEESFASDTLYKLDSVANLLGARFVGRLLVTSIFEKKPSQDFLAQAESRRIVVVTGEALPNIGTILKREAIDPTFPRM